MPSNSVTVFRLFSCKSLKKNRGSFPENQAFDTLEGNSREQIPRGKNADIDRCIRKTTGWQAYQRKTYAPARFRFCCCFSIPKKATD